MRRMVNHKGAPIGLDFVPKIPPEEPPRVGMWILQGSPTGRHELPAGTDMPFNPKPPQTVGRQDKTTHAEKEGVLS